jgi:tetratricopeptide (TPR) repeat protein
MRENYEQAYRLNPQLAGANAGLGWARFYDEEMEDAYGFFANAHRLEPDDPEINANVGSFLFSVGQIEAGIRYFTKAVESGGASANPMGPLYRRVISYVNIGRFAEAERDVRRMVSLESQDISLRILHARILARMRKTEEAEKELALVESLHPSHPDLPYVRAYILSAAGDKDRSLPILEKARKENPLYRSYFLSENYAELGMADEAVTVIRNGIEKGFSKVFYFLYPYQVLTSGAYQKILSDPRFQEILATQKKRNDEQLAKYRDLCAPKVER